MTTGNAGKWSNCEMAVDVYFPLTPWFVFLKFIEVTYDQRKSTSNSLVVKLLCNLMVQHICAVT